MQSWKAWEETVPVQHMGDIWCDPSCGSIAQEPFEGTLTSTNCSILEHKSALKRVWLTSASTVLLPKSAQTGTAEFNDRISCYDFTALSLNQIQLCFGNVSCAGLCFINRSIQWILAVTTQLLGEESQEIIHPDERGSGICSICTVGREHISAEGAGPEQSLQGPWLQYKETCRQAGMCQPAPRTESGK